MKWPAKQYDILLTAFQEFLNSCGRSKQEIRDAYADQPEAVLWDIYRCVVYDLQYDNNDSAYSAGVWEDGSPREARRRLVSHRPEFVLYPSGCKSTHLKTALRDIGRHCEIY